jgi:hypothetical protein
MLNVFEYRYFLIIFIFYNINSNKMSGNKKNLLIFQFLYHNACFLGMIIIINRFLVNN